ncbi:na-ca exchanger integrin-beta4 : Outer membrane adhesin like proteiin OS=Anabaena cylindrica (strain ATCC 27899 / PCC 7122) GN=Anacy_4636 PE=4 SV=1: Cna_B: PKD: Calx-beta: Calx-beta: PT-HINT: DUF2431 [Gemmataceae bacterium]|nr:na-ca exchanger integrin-beta4 : Outer membrane adhesin like proteiin OS=Anabaena cylindrica (strain ATCC 27899 / PCC 7122) GN=Anacy_4636 PE=4 SV=1: Cna_B: PKD: Calx-beta: Calx-beta: PT-HINT: DUF2431 [Gemmataceae bacterium]VTU01421.1 na-ca exchanger integrin-beta4 : Outer membrane adhesin like proteiin OS=Anabaena cylindrica (strain ATCC 27899 / PCC 7122) GN=Anacy_4636 PE=4 SV=1: Cna_B: PKD: Calx-beta: Calx-beta: PT-HINT: DUF2431 [Gemmataceae bacterium]
MRLPSRRWSARSALRAFRSAVWDYLLGNLPLSPRRPRLGFEVLEGRELPAAVPVTVFGTGVDAAGAALGDDQTDPHYVLVSDGGTGLMPGTARALVADGFPIGPWAGNAPDSRWVVPAATDGDVNAAPGAYRYRTTFDLTGIDPATVTLAGQWAADDAATIYLNGVSTGVTTAAPAYGALVGFTLTSGFRDGANTLDFVVSNAGGPTGLRVAALTGSGETGTRVAVPAAAFGTGVGPGGQLLPATAAPAATGLSPTGGGLPNGATDGNFTVTQAPAGFTGAARVRAGDGTFPFPHWAGAADASGSAWLVPAAADAQGNAPPGDYWFTTTVNVSNPAGLVLSGAWAADDQAAIFVNGVATGVTLGAPGYGAMAPFQLSGAYFKAGANQVQFRVTNGGATANPTGLRVAWDPAAPVADPHWTVVAAPSAALLGPTKVVAGTGYPFPRWVANDADSQWVAPLGAAADASAPPGTYKYQTTVDLTGYDPATAVLTGRWSADNEGVNVYLNGVPLNLTATGPNPGTGVEAYRAFTALRVAAGVGGAAFRPGVNTLTFEVRNDRPAPGSAAANPVGLRVDDLQLSAAPLVGAVRGTAWVDGDGDGARGPGEAAAAGVTVTLTGGPLAAPRTAVTDAAGAYAFAGLADGAYTVAFTPAPGYRVATPSGGQRAVTVTAGQPEVEVGAGLVTAPGAASAVTVSAAPAPAAFGQAVTVTASVAASAPATAAPTGSVVFVVDGGAPVTVPLSSTGGAALTLPALAAGTHAVTATYLGGPTFAVSTAQTVVTVARAGTATTLVPAAGGAVAGRPLTLAATVTVDAPGAGVPTGAVTFYAGGTALGSAPVGAGGVATLEVPAPAAGSYAVTAAYAGDGNFAESTSAEAPLDVRAATTTAVASSAPVEAFGRFVTLTATVSGPPGGPGVPTGTVTFYAGEAALGTAELDADGTGALAVSLPVGYHAVRAAYGGDAAFGPSEGTGDQTVDPAETQTQLAATWAGGTATLVATVSGPSGGTGTPAGTVTFYDRTGDAELGTATLTSAGTATLLVDLPGAAYDVIASYEGDDAFNPSSSSNAPPAAPDASARTAVGTPVAVNAALADPDGDTPDVTVTQPADGSVVYVGLGSFTYTPPAGGWTGLTSFTYTARDGRGGVATGTLSVRVADPDSLAADLSGTTSPKQPVAVAAAFDPLEVALQGHTQGAHGAVTFANGAFTYTPTDLAWTGADTFTYTVTDGTRTDTGVVFIDVTPWPDLVVTPTAGPAPADPGQAVAFGVTAAGGSGSGYTYAWDFGDSTDGDSGVAVWYAYPAPGVYAAVVTVTDGVGNTATAAVAVAVRDTVTVTGTGSVAEGSPPAAFVLTRTGSAGDLVVTYTLGGDPAATPAADYESLDGVVVIPDGATSVSVPFATLRDNLVEGNEVVSVTVADGYGYAAGAAATVSATIVDDPAEVTVAASGGTTEGSVTPGRFTLTRSGGDTEAPLTVRYALGGTAAEGEDYDVLGGVVTFEAGSLTAEVAVVARRDALVEGAEAVEFTVVPVDGATYLVGTDKAASLSIADDSPVVRLAAVSTAEAGAATGFFEVRRSGGDFGSLVTVPLSFGGTAAFGADYALVLASDPSAQVDPGVPLPGLPESVLIPGGTSAVYLRIVPRADNVVEPGGETVVLTAGASPAYATDASSPATVAIADDPPVVTADYYVPPDFTGQNVTSAPEGATGKLVLRRTGGDPSQPLTAAYTVSGTATAGAEGADYQPLSGTVTFPANSTQQVVSVVTLSDYAGEEPETVVLTVTDGGTNYQVGDSAGAVTFTITDATAVVSVQKVADAAEPSTKGSFVVTRQGGDTSLPLVVELTVDATAANAATAGLDYEALPVRVEFAPGELSQTVEVVPLLDAQTEGPETVTVAVGAGQYQAGGDPAVVTIADVAYDNKLFDFSLGADPSPVDEGTEFILRGTFTPPPGTAAGTKYVMAVDWLDGTPPLPTSELPVYEFTGSTIRFSATHAYADDGIHGLGLVPQSGDGDPSCDQPVVVTFTKVDDAASTARGTTTVTVKNVLPSAPVLSVEVNPQNSPGGPRAADDARGTLVRLVINVTDPGTRDYHRATIDWGDKTTSMVDFSRGPIVAYHTYEVGSAPDAVPGTRGYTITALVGDDDAVQSEDVVEGTTTVQINEQAPALSVDRITPDPVAEGSEVTVTGTLKNPGALGASGWQRVRIDWGDDSEPTFTDLFTWRSKDDYASNPTSPTYSTALGFEAKHTYANDRSTPYPVVVTVVDVDETAPPLAAAAAAAVANVAPSQLKLDLDAPSTVPTAANPQWFSLSGSFIDPGTADVHTVTIDWGDGETSQIDLIPGSRTLDPDSDIGSLLNHEYRSLPSHPITVTVTDDGPDGNNSVYRTIAFKVLAEPNVLSGYYEEAQKVDSGSVVEEIIAFGNRLYELAASEATAFTNAVGEFAGQLRDLEQTLRQLFTDAAPALLDGLLSDPAGFSEKFLKAVNDGFGKFFDNFGENLQGSLFEWISSKIPADLPITVADLPSNLTNLNQVAGFALKVMGLTRDDFVARLAGALGADNAQLLVQAYDFVQELLNSEDPTVFIDKLTTVFQGALDALPNGGNVGALLDDLKLANLAGATLDAIKGQALKAVGTAAAAKAAQFLNPLAGSFKVLFDAGRWLVNNVKSVQGMAEVFIKVAAQVDKIKAGDTEQAANEIRDALKAVGKIGLDLAASVAGINDIPTKVFNAVGGLRTKVQTPIDRVLNSVAAAAKAKLNKLLGDVGVGKTTDYIGLIGNVVTFKVGSETHRLWAVASSGSGATFKPARFILASTPDDLNNSVKQWTAQAKTDKVMQDLVNKEAKAQTTTTVKLTASEAAIAKYKTDQVGQGTGTPKQIATQNATITKDFKAVGTSVKDLAAALGQPDQTAPGTPKAELIKAVADCIGRACFVAGTPLRVPGGSKAIEAFAAGDVVLSRSEFDPSGPVEAKVVEEVFIRTGRVLNLHVGGQVIGTTYEHPFFEQGRGWVPAGELREGDRVATLSGEWVPVEEVFDTGCVTAVYNLRVADHHTYFVGCDEWGFGVWAHNAYDIVSEAAKGTTLLVGEGNLSFSVSLASKPGVDPHNLTPTTYEDEAAAPDGADRNAATLVHLGAKVKFDVDATNLAASYGGAKFHAIVWNFPLRKAATRGQVTPANQSLIADFFRSAAGQLSNDGMVMVTLIDGYFGRWKVGQAATAAGLTLVDESQFDLKQFSGYKPVTTYSNVTQPDFSNSKTYFFRLGGTS